MFENGLGIDIDAYDSSIDTPDGTLDIDASLDSVFHASFCEHATLLAVLPPTVDLEP